MNVRRRRTSITSLLWECVFPRAARLFDAFCAFRVSQSLTAIAVIMIEKNAIIGVTGTIAMLGNVGPAFGAIGPMGNYDILSVPTKIIFIFNMLIGRLELIPFLAMLHPEFWKIKK